MRKFWKAAMLVLAILAITVGASASYDLATVWQIGDVETIDPATGNLTDYKDEFNGAGGGYWPAIPDPFVVGTNLDSEFPANSNASVPYATDFDVQWYGAMPCGGRLTVSWSPGKSALETKIVTSTDSGDSATFTAQGYTDYEDGWNGYPLVESVMELGAVEEGTHAIRFQHTTGDGTWWDWVRLEAYQCEIEVDIDIKPDSDPNCFNINGSGLVPVAINGSVDFDVSTIDTSTLIFAGLEVRVKGNDRPQCAEEDWNGDGFTDLVCQFVDDVAAWSPGEAEATLTGNLLDGTAIVGTDSICITQ